MLRIACYVIAVVVFLSIQAEGAVSRGRANSTTTTDSAGNSVTRLFCVHRGNEYEVGAKWSYSFPDCLNCECTSSGWTCRGYGIKAGVFPTPPGCQPVPNTCEVKFVKESDPSQDCNSTA